MTSYRWRIVALLFLATTVNYIDRNVVSFVMIDDTFRHNMLGIPLGQALTEADTNHFKELFGYVDAAFKFAYALGFLFIGWIIDKLGTKQGFSISISIWGFAATAHTFVNSIWGMAGARFGLGIGEAGNFPASVKTVAEWFPKKERATATGWFNAGSNMGIITTALLVPWLVTAFGWRSAFLVTGIMAFVVLICWRIFYEKPQDSKSVSKDELAYILSDNDPVTESVSWGRLLGFKQTWAVAFLKFLTDPIWWFYLTWLPTFFNDNPNIIQKVDLKKMGIPFLVIYLISDVGSVLGGWLSSYFIKSGWEINRARKMTMLICALCVVPIFFASITSNIVIAVGLIALAAAAHQGFSANIYTSISDIYPKQAVGSVVGIAGMFGALGGALLAAYSGVLIARFGYMPLFFIAASAYLIALISFHFVVPKMERIEV
jgi:ACS family hexuronate transporter-like MFS transporter